MPPTLLLSKHQSVDKMNVLFANQNPFHRLALLVDTRTHTKQHSKIGSSRKRKTILRKNRRCIVSAVVALMRANFVLHFVRSVFCGL